MATFGIQLKPVIPLDVFDPLTEVDRLHLKGNVELVGGFAFGMSVRVGITNTISAETGIGQITRRYDFGLTNDTNGVSEKSQVRYVGYEIPITALAYIRLGEKTWMNAALGVALDMYPSDVQAGTENTSIYIYRHNWAQFGVLGNLGVEYRTDKAGIFYLGGTFHRPFNDMATADLTYYGRGSDTYSMRTTLDGSYLTLDIRYYFHEDPDRTRLHRGQ